MKKIVLILFLPILSFSQVINRSKLDSLVNDYGSISLFTGLVQISQNGKILYEGSYGYADRENKMPFNSKTKFNIASGGKSFTATLIMQLVEKGKIELNKPIQYYLPNYSIPNGDKITVHHLLTHTSGLSDYMLTPGYFERKVICKNIDEVMSLIIKMPLDFTSPGLKYRYSNSGYIVLGKILENIYKKPYTQILKDQILRPLSIDDFTLEFPAKYGQDNIAKPYYMISTTRAIDAVESEMPPFSDGGFIVSSPSLIRLFEGLYSGKLVNKNTLDLMSKNYLKQEEKLKYGYGFDAKIFDGIKGNHIGLTGGGAGFTTYVEMNTFNGLVISVCANNKFKSEILVEAIRTLLYNHTYQKPKQWVIQWLIDKMELNVALLPDLRTFILEGYGRDFNDPRYFIEAADLMQRANMIKESETLLLAVIKAYDKNSYSYSALGTFYLKQNKLDAAKKYFKKSIELDSTNMFAKNGIKQLFDIENSIIDKLYTNFRESFQKLDTATILKIYWEDAQYLSFDTEIQNGSKDFIKGFATLFNDVKSVNESLDISFQLEKRQFSEDGTMCVDVGYFEFIRKGEKLRRGIGKMVNVFTKKDNEWRFWVDMSSNAPLNIFKGTGTLFKNF